MKKYIFPLDSIRLSDPCILADQETSAGVKKTKEDGYTDIVSNEQ
jgi:hypothetical protein